MGVYLITYDLNKSGQNYDELYKEIKSVAVNQDCLWHGLESTWVIKSNLGVQAVAERLNKKIDSNDRLLVILINNTKQGWLTEEDWKKLNYLFT